MDLGLAGKRALVTGASAGLGAAAALALAQEGAEVVINSRNADHLAAQAASIDRSAGKKVHCVVGDLSSPGKAAEIASAARACVGDNAIDILVSNTGGPPAGDLLDHPQDRWESAAHLLLYSAIELTRALLPSMVGQRWGRLVYITSIAAIQPIDDLILSNTYRAGLAGFCKTISNNYARHGITANCVCPGYTATERLQELADSRAERTGKSPDQVLAGLATLSPSGRLGRPEELAAFIAFLASDKAGYITGTSIPVDGGANKSLK